VRFKKCALEIILVFKTAEAGGFRLKEGGSEAMTKFKVGEGLVFGLVKQAVESSQFYFIF